MTNDERIDRLEKHCGIDDSPVSLGEWSGWKLTWDDWSRSVHAKKDDYMGNFRPLTLLMHKSYSPELINALLTAYRRAVVAKLATLPTGWEWLRDEMPGWFDSEKRVWLGRGPVGIMHWYPHTTDDSREYRDMPVGSSRAAMLDLCDAAPGPVGVCLNRGCVSQRDGKCFDDGSCFDSKRCTSRVSLCDAQPAPVDADAQLREAGATEVASVRECVSHGFRAYIDEGDGNIFLCIDDIALPRAVATLKAATGTYEGPWTPQWYHTQEIVARDAQLAAANAKIADYKQRHEGQCKAIEQMDAECADKEREIHRLRALIDDAAKQAGEITRGD
jgi:hypothetical protein